MIINVAFSPAAQSIKYYANKKNKYEFLGN